MASHRRLNENNTHVIVEEGWKEIVCFRAEMEQYVDYIRRKPVAFHIFVF